MSWIRLPVATRRSAEGTVANILIIYISAYGLDATCGLVRPQLYNYVALSATIPFLFIVYIAVQASFLAPSDSTHHEQWVGVYLYGPGTCMLWSCVLFLGDERLTNTRKGKI